MHGRTDALLPVRELRPEVGVGKELAAHRHEVASPPAIISSASSGRIRPTATTGIDTACFTGAGVVAVRADLVGQRAVGEVGEGVPPPTGDVDRIGTRLLEQPGRGDGLAVGQGAGPAVLVARSAGRAQRLPGRRRSERLGSLRCRAGRGARAALPSRRSAGCRPRPGRSRSRSRGRRGPRRRRLRPRPTRRRAGEGVDEPHQVVVVRLAVGGRLPSRRRRPGRRAPRRCCRAAPRGRGARRAPTARAAAVRRPCRRGPSCRGG